MEQHVNGVWMLLQREIKPLFESSRQTKPSGKRSDDRAHASIQRDIFLTADKEGALPGGRRELGRSERTSSSKNETVRLSVFLCMPSSRAALL